MREGERVKGNTPLQIVGGEFPSAFPQVIEDQPEEFSCRDRKKSQGQGAHQENGCLESPPESPHLLRVFIPCEGLRLFPDFVVFSWDPEFSFFSGSSFSSFFTLRASEISVRRFITR